MPRLDLIQWRRGDAAEWTSVNPTLASGEAGFEDDTGQFKIGDGTTAWVDLDYAGGAGPGGTPDPHAASHADGGSDEVALDASQITTGTINASRLPALAIGDTFTVASEAAMLALTAQRGDVAIRTDLDPDGFFLLVSDSPGTLADWKQILAPGSVLSVDGRSGAVSLSDLYQPLDSDLTAIAALTTPATTITGAAQKASNLSDLASAATARTNLGAAADASVVHLAGTETITGTKTLSDGGNLIIVHDDDGPTFYSVYGVADKTNLPPQVNRPVMKLEAGLDATLDLLSHDYNIGLIVQNSTADGAALSVGNTASGDGIYAQATGTAHALTNTPHAVNVSAGPLTLLDTASGTATATTATTLTDAGAGWTDDEWIGRWVVTPDVSDPATAKRMRVTDNDDDTLTGTGGWVSSQTPPFAGQSPTTTPSGTTPYVIPNSSANGINMHITSTGHAFRALRVAGAGNGGVGDEMILLDDATGAGYYLRGVAGATQKFAVGIDGSWSGRNLIGLVGTSGTANQTSRWKGCTTTGSPTGATFATGDWVTTLDGHIWVCISGGPPGNWVDVGGGGGSGDVATDTIWDAAGDLVVGTGADTAARLAIGTGGTFLRAGSSTLAWAVPAISEISGLTAALAAKAALAGATFTGAVILDADPATALEAATKQYVDAAAGGSVAADAIWDAAGDIVYGTGADTATRLAVGTGGTFLKVSAGVPVWAVPAISEISGLTAALAAKALQTDLDAHTGETTDAHDASAISILDTANDFTATDVEGALAELQSDAEADATALSDHVADTTAAHAASAISFTPDGSIAATTVQAAIVEVRDEAAGGGAPSTADFLVGTANGGLSAEIVVGTTPNGELGGTWDAITVDATHSGSSHADVQTAAEGTAATALSNHVAAADPHTGYVLETLFDANTVLAATSDNTPAALTVAEQTLVGRITAGNIAALTASQVRTLLALVVGTNVQAWDADLDTWATKTAPSGTVVGTTDTQTQTNKRITKRVSALADPGATPSINTDNFDVVNITGQTSNITSFTTNLTGTPVEGDTLRISITGTAARTIAWGASFEASTVALPTTTVTTARLDVGFFWNTATSKWRVVGTA